MKSVGLLSRHTKSVLTTVFIFTMCSFAATTTRAEMPPSAYSSFQQAAPEALEVEIISVEQSTSETKEAIITSVVLVAKVLNVKRTATQLKPGATIMIKYDHRESKMLGWAGPSPVPILHKGDQRPAYLKQLTDSPPVYETAAGGYTFRTVRE